MFLRSSFLSLKKYPILVLVMVGSVLFFATAFFYVQTSHAPSGDEPHFLIISQTILKYHSLDVLQDYNHGDYRLFYPKHIDPHITYNARGEILPLHSIGAPLLWLLPFFLSGRQGAVLFIALLAVLTVVFIYKFLREMAISERTAFLVAFAYIIASPLYLYSYRTFIEPIGAFACIYLLTKIAQKRLSLSDIVISSLLLGILPWIHIRFALLETPLFCVLLYRVYQQYRSKLIRYWLLYLVPVTLLFLLLELYSYKVWGTFNPAANQIYGGSKPFEVQPYKGLLGIFLDQEYGLLLNFPVFLFLLVGLPLALKKKFLGYNLLMLTVSIPYIVAFTSFRHWSGGWSPPARFILVLLPLYSFYIAYALERCNNWFTRCVLVLGLGYGFLYNILALLSNQQGFNGEKGHNTTLASLQLFNHHLTDFLPSLYLPDQVPLFVIWAVVCVGIAILVRLSGKFSDWRSTIH